MLFKTILVVASVAVTSLVHAHDHQAHAKDGEKGKAKAEEAVINPDATADDVKKVDCTKLTADILNKLTNKKACTGLTATCLAKFDTTKVCGECLGNMPLTEWKNLESSTVEQITRTTTDNLDITKDQFEAILPKIHLNQVADTFAEFIVRTPALLELILTKGDGKLLGAFITSKTMAILPLGTFSRFSKSMISHLKANAFANINSTQLAIIPNEAFEGFEPTQWEKVNSEALTGLTRDQAAHLSTECWNATTMDQIKNFGKSLNNFQKGVEAKKVDPILDRRQYKAQHPCNSFEEAKGKMEEKKAKAFEERCKEITAFKVNGSAASTTSLAALALTMAVALVPFLY